MFYSEQSSGQRHVVDSLLHIPLKNKPDTAKLNILNTLSNAYLEISDYDSAFYYGNLALNMSQRLELPNYVSNSFISIGGSYLGRGDYTNALDHALKALKIDEEIKDPRRLVTCYAFTGFAYGVVNDNTSELAYYNKALKIAEKINDTKLIESLNVYFGIAYHRLAVKSKGDERNELYDKTLDYYLKALKFNEEVELNKSSQARHLGNIGCLYNEVGNYKMALKYFNKGLIISKNIGRKRYEANMNRWMSISYVSLGKYKEAYDHIYEALGISHDIHSLSSMRNDYEALTSLYEKSNISLKDTLNGKMLDKEGMRLRALYFFKRYITIRDTLLGTENQKKQVRLLMNYEFKKKEDLAKAEQDKKDIIAAEEKQKQKVITYAVSSGLILVLLLTFFIFRGYRQKQKSNDIITLQNKELEKLSIVASKSENTVVICNTETELIWANEAFTNLFGYTLDEYKKVKGNTIYEISASPHIKRLVSECIEKRSGVSYETKNYTKHRGERWFQTTLSPVFNDQGGLQYIVFIDSDITELKTIELQLHEKNKEITDSINYAKRIQQAIFASESDIKKHFPESFLLYLPKDIVAGDFYFYEATDTHAFFAAADCTGHGVPGALVSVVCSNALSRCVKEFELTDPGKILDKARELILVTLKKSGQDIKDGMDISLLVKNIHKGSLKWAGANNILWYLKNNEINEITANKQPVGQSEDPKPFTSHSLALNKGDVVFLITDGYADQFGGPNGKKFKYKQLKDLLFNNSSNISEARNILLEEFYRWKGDLEQVDDVCIIGIKV